MFDPTSRRFAGMAGLLFVAIFLVALVAFLPSGLPNSGEPGSKVVSYVTEHRGALLTSAFLQGLAIIPFLAFLAAVVGMLRRAEGDRGGWSLMAAVGGVAGSAVVLVACAVGAIMVYRASAGDEALARTLLDANTIVFAMSGFPAAVFLFAASQGLAATGLVARWVAPLGMLVALLQIVGAAALADGDGFFSPQGAFSYIAAIAFMVWVLVVAGSLVREQSAVAASPATA